MALFGSGYTHSEHLDPLVWDTVEARIPTMHQPTCKRGEKALSQTRGHKRQAKHSRVRAKCIASHNLS